MMERWLGRRGNGLRLLSGEKRSESELREAAALLHASRAAQERRMSATLASVRERVLRSPVHASTRAIWERIHGLDDLSTAPCMSSNILPEMTDEAPDWSKWLTKGEALLATAATSGSSGTSKLMPYTEQSVQLCAMNTLPHLANATLELAMPGRPTVLNLSAPKGYATYVVVPAQFVATGYDVMHVPLQSILSEPGVALDLIDWLLEPATEVHAICAMLSLLPLMISALEEHSGGARALERLSHSLRGLFTGGTELNPILLESMSARFNLSPADKMDFFAATEPGVVATSQKDSTLYHASLNSHVISIMPIEEAQKAESDPDYLPRSTLLTRAPVGLVGELVCCVDAAVPWINLRQGDVFEVAEPPVGSDVPRLRHLARLSAVQDVGGGRVWPASYRRAMDQLGGTVTDYLAMSLKPGDPSPDAAAQALTKDRLAFFYEGTATIERVGAALFDAIPMLETTGPKLKGGTFDMTILNVRAGTLRRCRQRKASEQGGSPGPLKHQVVRGPRYHVPVEDVIVSKSGWCAPPRASHEASAISGE